MLKRPIGFRLNIILLILETLEFYKKLSFLKTPTSLG